MPVWAVVLSAVLLAGCGSGEVAEGDVLPSASLPPEEDPGLAHVHGLGVNPADGHVYAATHFGLWRLTEEDQPERVGDAVHDLMGFTVAGDDHFLASGHPLVTDDIPPLLGLIETTDGGETWRSVSLLGEVDFHVLRVAHDGVWGWTSGDGAVMVNDDGQGWQRRSTVTSLLDFVVNPEDPDRLLAAVATSPDDAGLHASRDGGRSWQPTEGPPLARLAWEQPDRLWGVGLDGTVWRSRDGGGTWEDSGTVTGRPEAFADAGERLLIAAGGSISQSVDDGATWTELYRGH